MSIIPVFESAAENCVAYAEGDAWEPRRRRRRRKHRDVPFQVRFVALTRNPDGTLSVYDIIDTSYHFAPGFFRRFQRDADVCAVDVVSADNVTTRRVNFPRTP